MFVLFKKIMMCLFYLKRSLLKFSDWGKFFSKLQTCAPHSAHKIEEDNADIRHKIEDRLPSPKVFYTSKDIVLKSHILFNKCMSESNLAERFYTCTVAFYKFKVLRKFFDHKKCLFLSFSECLTFYIINALSLY